MLDQISALFTDPAIQEQGKKRLMELLGGGGCSSATRMQDTLRAAGKAMMSTPGNALAGIAAGSGAAADAYAPQPQGKESGEAALKLMDKLLNYGKATESVRQKDQGLGINQQNADTSRFRAEGSVRQGDARQNLAERLGISTMEDRTAGNNVAQQNADTSRINAISGKPRNFTPVDPAKLQLQAQQVLSKAKSDIFKDREFMDEGQLQSANQEYQALEQKLQGILKGGTTAPAPTTNAPPPKAIEALMQNPGRAAEFDQMFGPGSAAQILQGR